MKRLAAAILLLTLSVAANAQFYQQGNAPASLRWSQFKSADYHMIYPRGMDSLARVFNEELERWRIPVGNSIGFVPNQQYRKPMPVILHTLNASANGTVAWAPRRMELYAVPDAYSPEPLPWVRELAIHEGRHVAQMQFGRYKGFRFMSGLLGEMWTGAMCAVYTGPAFLEGDAVATETALTSMGRGRSADFLEYNMVAFENGDYRNWYQWRYGSIRKFTPDHYRLGYLTIAGMRSFYDQPLFTKNYYDRIFNRYFGYPFFNFQKSVREMSGRRLRDAWTGIAESFAREWADNAAQRGPFMDTERLMETPRSYKEYNGAASDGNAIYAIESGLRTSRNLVRISLDGTVEQLRPFAIQTGSLMWSEPMKRLYWSETIRDRRWELKESSIIRWYDPVDGSTGDLGTNGRLFNPAPHPSKNLIAVTEYPFTGGSALMVLDAVDGHVILRIGVPGNLQAVEAAWLGDDLLFSAIGEDGFGIFNASQGFKEVLAPQARKIKQLRNVDGHIEFLSDRNGVHELYTLEGGSVRQLTSTRFGISSAMHIDGRLYYSSLGQDGRLIAVSPEQDGREVDFAQSWQAPTPEKLSRQERELAIDNPQQPAISSTGETRNYSKAGHLFRLHSWAPIYFDYDRIQSLSFDQLYMAAAPGATLLFQNNHGMSGSLGYSWNGTKSGYHAKIEYSGLYPVIEGQVDVNEDEVRHYKIMSIYTPGNGETRLATMWFNASYPSVSGSIRTYIPLVFSKGGWNKGVIPMAKLSFTNDMFDSSIQEHTAKTYFGGTYYHLDFTGYQRGLVAPLTKLGLSVRAYSMLSKPSVALYPRLGIGAELGYGVRPGIARAFSSNAYAYVYGYLPGFLEGHSLKLSVMNQFQINGSHPHFRESHVYTVPGGLTGEAALTKFIDEHYPVQTDLNAEYAFPAISMDWAGLGPLAYVRNMEFRFLGEFAFYGNGIPDPGKNLYGIGASVALNLGNFLWLPFDTRLGVQYIRNGGSLIATAAPKASLDNFGMVFSVDF